MKTWITAFIVGITFGLGLGISGMAKPDVVLAFLDIAGDWNPALLAVMGGALAFSLPAYQWLFRRSRPLFSAQFHVPKSRVIDQRLLTGSAVFGVGWGLSGYCPGTGIVAVASGALEALTFTASMLAGFYLFNRQSAATTAPSALGEKS